MILVTGATGTVGSEVLRALNKRGAKAAGLVHTASKAGEVESHGAEARVGDFNDRASLDAALEGVQKVFLVTPTEPDQLSLEGAMIDAAKDAGVEAIVKLSVVNADPAADEMIYRNHGESERLLRDSGMAHTVLRCNDFMQNLLFSAAAIAEGELYSTEIAGGKLASVDVRDIANVAATLLRVADHEGQVHEVTGPEALTYDEIAAQLTSALGREVKYIEILPDDFRAAAIDDGVPDWMADALIGIYRTYARGMAERVSTTVHDVTGAEPRSVAEFANDYSSALVGSQ